MAKFVLVYTGGKMAETPEAQQASMEAWGAWFGSLGNAVADMGAPFGASTMRVQRRHCRRQRDRRHWLLGGDR